MKNNKSLKKYARKIKKCVQNVKRKKKKKKKKEKMKYIHFIPLIMFKAHPKFTESPSLRLEIKKNRRIFSASDLACGLKRVIT